MKNHGLILLAIFIGGALGTIFRFLINTEVSSILFPLGTVIENLGGSLLLGLLTGYILNKEFSPILKEGIGVGFCGGFTTMSTLAADTIFLFGQASSPSIVIYLVSSLFGGILLAVIGMAMSTAFVHRKKRADEIQ
ncbi:CrcB family protein [Evansella sp. AB-P1]|uniref:fluoride efflux transporter FluC n=1 Tax=Evansella sp. AB-P1 TaxID=3037653 RepID=UPI00241C8EF3|nr:CrcB family protein [Evansella sp. AB-P1]MDG5787987.1 CrcB family protein [Evansella sp. AB-P1]